MADPTAPPSSIWELMKDYWPLLAVIGAGLLFVLRAFANRLSADEKALLRMAADSQGYTLMVLPCEGHADVVLVMGVNLVKNPIRWMAALEQLRSRGTYFEPPRDNCYRLRATAVQVAKRLPAVDPVALNEQG